MYSKHIIILGSLSHKNVNSRNWVTLVFSQGVHWAEISKQHELNIGCSLVIQDDYNTQSRCNIVLILRPIP